jgi:hypothetical protein
VSRSATGNAFGPAPATPYLEAGHAGGTALLVSLVTLGGDPTDLTLDVRVRDEVVEITFPDGERVEIELGDRPRYLRRGPDGSIITWDAE